jgi:hypothetical protein
VCCIICKLVSHLVQAAIVSNKYMFRIFLSDLGDKIVIIEIIYYLLHVVIIGRGRMMRTGWN